MATDLIVAETILQQLGGRKFLVMTGAKNLAGDGNSLRMHLPRVSKGVKYVKITLTPMDVYEVEFMDREGGIVAKREDVYEDMLQEVFTNHTGLYTRL